MNAQMKIQTKEVIIRSSSNPAAFLHTVTQRMTQNAITITKSTTIEYSTTYG